MSIEPVHRVKLDGGGELAAWCVLVSLLNAHIMVAQGVCEDVATAYDLCEEAVDSLDLDSEYGDWPGVISFVNDIVARGWVNVDLVEDDAEQK